jgi:hypothetical protein
MKCWLSNCVISFKVFSTYSIWCQAVIIQYILQYTSKKRDRSTGQGETCRHPPLSAVLMSRCHTRARSGLKCCYHLHLQSSKISAPTERAIVRMSVPSWYRSVLYRIKATAHYSGRKMSQCSSFADRKRKIRAKERHSGTKQKVNARE